ncbi:rhodanese-like domain-containing protein [Rhodococcus koreensis]|uniref:rhodanese-like domain-containing protein n=1 Tax=Rhodococcus koreensis TaxID=99653 RepID=UPI0036DE7890
MTAPTTTVTTTAPAPADLAPLPISGATAHRRRTAGALLIDIRPQVARHQGTIDRALIMDTADIADTFGSHPPIRLRQLTRDRDLIVCSVSGRRARPVAEQLIRLGYTHVYYLAGGFDAWQSAHRTGH